MTDQRDRIACPPADVLARVAAGEGDASERMEVADHLGTCRACSEEYRVATALGPWARTLASDAALPSSPTRRRFAGSNRAIYGAAAAALVIAAAASLGWALALRAENARLATELQATRIRAGAQSQPRVPTPDATERAALDARTREIEDLRARLDAAQQPAINVPIVDLEPADPLRGPERRRPAQVPASAPLITFVLTTPTDPGTTPHELEIAAQSGAVVWRSADLRANVEKTFVVVIPRPLLPDGTSVFRLYTLRSGTRTLVQDYEVRVTP